MKINLDERQFAEGRRQVAKEGKSLQRLIFELVAARFDRERDQTDTWLALPDGVLIISPFEMRPTDILTSN